MALIEDVLSQAVVPALRGLFDGRDPPKVDQALVLGTGLVESGYRALAQRNGPALGFWQMEPATYEDCWTNFINHRFRLSAAILHTGGFVEPPSALKLATDLILGAQMCRVKYLRDPEPLPGLCAQSLAQTWKRVYNTPLGAGDVAQAASSFATVLEIVK